MHITRVAGPVISGSGCGKNNPSLKPLLADRIAEIIVELLGDVARQFEMLLLVLADRHMGGAIEQNVGRHQHRIIVEADRGVLAILAGLFLELRHAVEPADPRHAIEDPCQFGVPGHLALVEDDMLFGIDAGGDKGRGDFPGVARELGRAAPDRHRLRERVHIDNAIETVVGLLQLDEIDDRAEVIAKMQIAGRLHPRKNPLNHRHHMFPLFRAVVCHARFTRASRSAGPA